MSYIAAVTLHIKRLLTVKRHWQEKGLKPVKIGSDCGLSLSVPNLKPAEDLAPVSTQSPGRQQSEG